MRYIKIASAKNPINDYIELNDFQGYFCTSLQGLGFSRKIEYLKIQNRQDNVNNQVEFKDYSLTIEILTNYANFEPRYRELTTFLDRNKNNGLRLYYRPYDNMETTYMLCDIKSFTKTEKRQPLQLIVTQKSFWLSEEKKITTNYIEDERTNLFVFDEDSINNYYSANFELDNNTEIYCIAFFGGFTTQGYINIQGYNDIPLKIKIYGKCVEPIVSLFRKGEGKPIKKTQVYANVDNGYHLEINSNIFENGIWLVNNISEEKTDYTELVNNALGSPYFFVNHGEYYITIVDSSNSECITDVLWQEEYS